MAPNQPSRGDVHVNRPLTNLSLAFMQSEASFVAGRVFQTIPVKKQSDLYFEYDRHDWNRDEMKIRAPGTETAGSNYKIGQNNYFCPVRGWHRDVADQIRENADDPIQLDREAVNLATTKYLITREVNWALQYFTAGDPGDTWTFDVDGAGTASGASFDPTDSANNQVLFWNNASSTPIEDVRLLCDYVQEATGFRPNTLTLGRRVFSVLQDHPDIVGRLDRGQTDGPAMATREALAALFEMDEVIVMGAVKTTTDEGVAAASQQLGFIGGKHALLSYRPPAPGLYTPAAGYTFAWTGYLGATREGSRIKRFRMEAKASDRIEIEAAFDQKVVSADLGAFFGGIVE